MFYVLLGLLILGVVLTYMGVKLSSIILIIVGVLLVVGVACLFYLLEQIDIVFGSSSTNLQEIDENQSEYLDQLMKKHEVYKMQQIFQKSF